MKFATVSKSLVLGLAVLLASSAFAATKANLHLDNPTNINGTKLKPGDYKLVWDGTGPDVEVSIMQGKTVCAKAQAPFSPGLCALEPSRLRCSPACFPQRQRNCSLVSFPRSAFPRA